MLNNLIFRKQFFVEKIITHPGYVADTKKDDIALLKLKTKVIFYEKLKEFIRILF